ncbi:MULTISPECIES: cytochrome P450 [Bacillus]|uniref:Cytochrome P450 n=1 Tax=Bacillus glycinifermentans TaxID=1664069 RepID=A0AAJ3YZC7_9BACI|nr:MULTISPECIES: cytochrome P450 [Bacillus]KKB73648.1 cytochrome P450 [Bacillus sp. TH008]MBU8785078.1 cytochrome P450 [Bacillus glycinifermentans]MDU0073734.1 cytochrome P450 [Bacillus sp. IG6]MED8021622.1 cytochrome P450 [Bacillus glycinifermentans]NUJ15250.1 cytochrome P450 [Bacillus glycinifermentans]
MTNSIQTSNRYANWIPMKEISSSKDRLFPFPIYNRLRQTSPVRFDDDRKCWDIFAYEDVQYVLKSPKLFSSKRGGDMQGKTMLTMDPPRHTSMRAIVNKAFTPKAVKQLESHIGEVTAFLLDETRDRRSFDLVDDLAAPLPVIIIAELLGVPPEDRSMFKHYSDILVSGASDSSDEAVKLMSKRRKEGNDYLKDYFKRIIKERKKSPKEDLISLLIQAEVEGEKLTEEELLGFCTLLLVAGNETTTNLIANAVRYLTEDAHTQEAVRHDLSLVPHLVEETLRYYPPVQAIGRVAAQDTEIRGVSIPKGSSVISWVASANRDETKFDDPESFRLDRKSNPHMSFGFGIHFCLGAPLARLEANIALSHLLRHASVERDDRVKLEAIQSPFVFGVRRLPVRLLY